MKHLLKMLDLSTEDITEILNLADQLKYEQKHGIEHRYLAGKTLGMIFEKASTRTRVSFEVGMYQPAACRFSFRPVICRSAAANRSRIQLGCCPVTSMEL